MTAVVHLEEIIYGASSRLRKLDDAVVSIKPSPEKWSKKEILGHLIDSANNNYRRFLLANLQQDLVFDGYDQVAHVRINNYQSRDYQELINIWEMANVQISQLIRQIPEEKMNLTTDQHNFHQISMRPVEPKSQSSLRYLLEDYNYHTLHHLKQILGDVNW